MDIASKTLPEILAINAEERSGMTIVELTEINNILSDHYEDLKKKVSKILEQMESIEQFNTLMMIEIADRE
jgi:hypothetical protein